VTTTFRDLGVDAALCDALEAKGITHPFPIQAMTLPMALAGGDLIGQARTGTGKTLAFGLPLLQRIDTSDRFTQALVVVPTRELCVQVHDDLSIGAAKGITTIAVYGGTPYEEQTAALESGVNVVVGTPGRLLDHLNRGSLDLSRVRVLVLDEADEMLDMGFLPDVERLIESCPTGRHTMLFSATMPTAIVRMGRRYMVSPTFTRADITEAETAPNVAQHFLKVHRMDKARLLARILQAPERGNVYVFVRTKHMADRLVEELEELGTDAIAIHGDLRQATREKNLDRFRAGKVTVLVATEVAARGLDVENVTHVVNYDCPEDEKMYLHRIGRTARAGNAGVAVTFVEHSEVERANLIRRAIDKLEIEVKEMFSTSPELIELFELPTEVPWARSVVKRRAPSEETGRGGRGGGRDGGGRDGGGRDGGGRGSRGGGRDSGGRSARSEERSKPEPRTERAERPERAERTEPSERRERTGRSGEGGRERAAAPEAPPGSGAPRVRTRERGVARPVTDEASGAGPSRAVPGDADSGDAPRRRRRGGRGRGRGRSEDGTAAATSERSPERDRDRSDRSDRSERSGERATGSGERKRSAEPRAARTRASGSSPVRTDPTATRGEGQPQLARRVKVEHLP
jgi:superfamily II DNA/RNA helicase